MEDLRVTIGAQLLYGNFWMKIPDPFMEDI